MIELDHTAEQSDALAALRQLQQPGRLPLSKADLKLAKACVARATLDELREAQLLAPPIPQLADAVYGLAPRERLEGLQAYISSFQYNFIRGYHYNVRKRRPYSQIMGTAQEIRTAGLPIKCIEACFLAALLTCRCSEWVRYPAGFKSKVAGHKNAFRHIVLIVHDRASQRWGALGISRRSNLMFKPLVYETLSALIADFRSSYVCWTHELVKVRIGLPLPHNPNSTCSLCWRYCNAGVTDFTWAQVARQLDDYAANACSLRNDYYARLQRRSSSATGLQRGGSMVSLQAGCSEAECSDSEEERTLSPTRRKSLA